MKEIVNKLKGITTVLATLATLDGYRRTILDVRVTEEKIKATEALAVQTAKNEKIANVLNIAYDRNKSLSDKIAATSSRLDEWKEKLYAAVRTHNSGNKDQVEAATLESLKVVKEIASEVTDLEASLEIHNSSLERTLSNIPDSTNSLIGLDTLQSLLADLSPHQMGALGHIFAAISIYYCVMNILSAYYGDVIINYLKLATRFPKLARWIQYRKTYQQYNIPFNLFLILGIAGFTLFVDISVFNHL